MLLAKREKFSSEIMRQKALPPLFRARIYQTDANNPAKKKTLSSDKIISRTLNFLMSIKTNNIRAGSTRLTGPLAKVANENNAIGKAGKGSKFFSYQANRDNNPPASKAEWIKSTRIIME